MIDSHVHFWNLTLGMYDWITPKRPILNRDYVPGDFLALTQATDVVGCIAVQAAPTEAETDFLLTLAASHSEIRGVIGWTDLTLWSVGQSLDRWRSEPNLKGIRPMAAGLGTVWLSAPEYANGLVALATRDLILEALVLPHHLSGVAAVARAYPSLQIVINHAAKVTPDNLGPWTAEMNSFKDLPNISCKLSGLTQQSLDFTHHSEVFNRLLEVFGPTRLLWGSDFPVLMETSDYQSWLNTTAELLSGLSIDDARQITTQTAKRIYKLS